MWRACKASSTPPSRASGDSKKSGSSEPATPAVARPADPAFADVKFLTVAEVAAVMRVSKMTVYRMVHSAELPAVRVGRSFRVPERAVHDYLRAAFIEAG